MTEEARGISSIDPDDPRFKIIDSTKSRTPHHRHNQLSADYAFPSAPRCHRSTATVAAKQGNPPANTAGFMPFTSCRSRSLVLRLRIMNSVIQNAPHHHQGWIVAGHQ
jgi:hypothetical protein